MRDRVIHIFNISLFVVIFLVLGVYAYNRGKDLIFGPEITIHTPKNGIAHPEEMLVIEGGARNASRLFLNDSQIFTDEAGNFSEKLLLHYGYNIIEITAIDRFGKKEEELLHVVYQ